MRHLTIQQLKNRVEKATKERELVVIWNEIANNKYSFSLQEIKEMNEKIREKVLKLTSDNSEVPDFYMYLLRMNMGIK